MTPDFFIVGSGAIGLTIAWELARTGASVTVIDKGALGREASWAGAGMIPPGELGTAPGGHHLAAYSSSLWPEFTAELLSQSGIDNGYRRCGGITIGTPEEVAPAEAAWSDLQIPLQRVEGPELRTLAPELNSDFESALWFPTFAQVRNPRQLQALTAACRQLGVRFVTGDAVREWQLSGETITAAMTDNSTYHAGRFIVATGAWTTPLLQPLGWTPRIEPVRGQIVLLRTPSPILKQVIERGTRYLVPRDDGRVLIGATEERVGFVKENTLEGIRLLREFACNVIPALQQAEVEMTWSGLRPWSESRHPWIGRHPERSNLYVAAGHFRAGLANSVGTARLLRQCIFNQSTDIPLTDFSPATGSPS
ncbi:glycine oxidase ThiO [Planctomicrobium sp. SH664]|uniref:glycine oxidase ThiO n=1 Tax=Planctomicrobium sp. SH664 TaxID=3448125 RepID=UPI003F5AF91E